MKQPCTIDQLYESVQLPAQIPCRLRDFKSVSGLFGFAVTFKNSLELQREAVTLFIAVVRNDRHDHSGIFIGKHGLVSHKNMGVTRIIGPFALFQLLSLLRGTDSRLRRAT
jgi:hypothetical protein